MAEPKTVVVPSGKGDILYTLNGALWVRRESDGQHALVDDIDVENILDAMYVVQARMSKADELLMDMSEALELSLARLGCCGEGDGKDRRSDADSYGGMDALERAREYFKEKENGNK